MVSDVGIKAGVMLQHLGTPAELSVFFALIDRHKSKSADGKLELVTDRLFKRTVAGDQLDALEAQLVESRRILDEVPADERFLKELRHSSPHTKVDRGAATVGGAFGKVFDTLIATLAFARGDKGLLGYVRPVHLQTWEGPMSYQHDYMKPEEFEKPDMRPIWME